MQLIDTYQLNDKLGFNHGQPATLIKIENATDYDLLLDNILQTSYYDEKYFERHYTPGTYKGHFWFIANILKLFQPKKVLEIGCGRGDVLSQLASTGHNVHGTDYSASPTLWPNLLGQVTYGDFLNVSKDFKQQGQKFDLILAFDIWEHFHPKKLQEAIQGVVDLATDDAFFMFIIPAFGEDRIFGERFPLEFEENRSQFDARVPFTWLLTEKTKPPIPANGHLIWAHTEWWEAEFQKHGLFRNPEIEHEIHMLLDGFLPNSVKAFFILKLKRMRDEEVEAPANPKHKSILVALKRTLFIRFKIAFSLFSGRQYNKIDVSKRKVFLRLVLPEVAFRLVVALHKNWTNLRRIFRPL